MTLESFKQYAKHKDGTYVAFQMSKNSRAMLDNFVAMNLGLEERVDPSSYHITIIYSRTPVPAAEQFEGMTHATATATGYEIFPTKTGSKCLVMRVSSADATDFNKRLTDMGATSDYDQYKAHVTIAYNIEQEIDPSTLPLPQFQLEFGEIHVAPLDPEFVPGNV